MNDFSKFLFKSKLFWLIISLREAVEKKDIKKIQEIVQSMIIYQKSNHEQDIERYSLSNLGYIDCSLYCYHSGI